MQMPKTFNSMDNCRGYESGARVLRRKRCKHSKHRSTGARKYQIHQRLCLCSGLLPFTSLFDSGCPAPKHGNPAHALRFSPSSVFQWISAASEKKKAANTNNVKTDYNSGNYEQIIEKSWHENSADAHWRKGPTKGAFLFSLQSHDFPSEPVHGLVL